MNLIKIIFLTVLICIIKMFDLIAKIKQLDIKSINNLELRKFI